MRVTKIKIDQILGVEHLEIEPGNFVQISGENGSGKTSCLEAIKSLGLRGHDATLLRNGADKGEIVFVLSDGTEITKRVTAAKTDTSVVHPTYGRISKPADFIKKLVDALSLNPVEFLTAKSEDRVDLLLKAIPMTVTADQLGFVPVAALNGVDLSGHALPVIAKIDKAIFDLRTGVNRAAKEKRITANQMSEGLPAAPPEGDWSTVLQTATAEYKELQKSATARVSAIKSDAQTAKQSQIDLCSSKTAAIEQEQWGTEALIKEELTKAIDQLRADAASRVEKLRVDSALEVSRCTEERDAEIAKIEHSREGALKAVEADYQPKHAALSEKLGQAKAMVEAHTKAATTREHIAQWNSEAEKMENESERLTKAMESLEALKSSLVGSLPIEGLEVRENGIFVKGLPFDRVNTAQKVKLAIAVAKLRVGTLPLIACDGMENLDSKTFEAFKKEAEKSGCQFVISRVTDGPFLIESEGAA